MRKKIIVGSILVLFAVLLVFLNNRYDFLNPTLIESVVLDLGMFAPFAYGIFYFIVVLLFLPATFFTVLSGVLFGKIIGTIIVVISATAAASTAFILSRVYGGSFVNKVSKSNKVITSFHNKIEANCQKNGFRFFFIMRCLFLPYILFSYAAGLVQKAKLSEFTLATFATNIIFSFAFVYLGDSLLAGPKALILPIILVLFVLVIPKIVKKIKNEN